MYSNWLEDKLICPETHKPLYYRGNEYSSGERNYKLRNEILSVVYPNVLNGGDAKYNKFYNLFAPLYDLNERITGKLLLGLDMLKGRKEISSLPGLEPGMRVLEVSPGPGVFQKFLRDEIEETGELVSLDLSMEMLRQCQKNNRRLNVELVHANAQYLPFADNSFDAVFHFGGINLFNDPNKAISEFIRVVRKDGIVSWGDEGFSPDYKQERRKKILLRLNPGFGKPHPVIPDSLYDVKEKEVYDGLAYMVVAKKR